MELHGMKTLARFIARPKDGDKPDLGLMAFFCGNDVLKAGRVYEIQEIFGEIVIKDMGESCVASEMQDSHPVAQVCWGNDASQILRSGKNVFLTREEADKL